MTHEEFVDLCILCGCDYTHSIGGIGPGTAFKLISECKTIEKAIKNIKNIDYPKKEIIVIDNGSTDGSQKIIKKINGIKKILRKKNLGVARTIQECLQKSTGDYNFSIVRLVDNQFGLKLYRFQ